MQVGRLDVAVDHALLVGVLQPERRLADVVAGLGRPAAGRLALDQLAEVGPSTYSITRKCSSPTWSAS